MLGEERDEQKEFESGPLNVLMDSVKKTTQVMIIILLIIIIFIIMLIITTTNNNINILPQ